MIVELEHIVALMTVVAGGLAIAVKLGAKLAERRNGRPQYLDGTDVKAIRKWISIQPATHGDVEALSERVDGVRVELGELRTEIGSVKSSVSIVGDKLDQHIEDSKRKS